MKDIGKELQKYIGGNFSSRELNIATHFYKLGLKGEEGQEEGSLILNKRNYETRTEKEKSFEDLYLRPIPRRGQAAFDLHRGLSTGDAQGVVHGEK